ncbi:MAG: hypothetical protein RR235_08570 [Oscillospiraceae bacterium]
MREELVRACGDFLSLLPECRESKEAIAEAAEYFELRPARLREAAERLPESYDLSYKGVRLLLSAYIGEFLSIFSESKRKLCEVSVPAPLVEIMALQTAGTEIRFSTGALAAQVVLRSLLVCGEPLDIMSCPKRRCGLNKMRVRLFEAPPLRRPDYLLQFGVLCDECVKCGEGLGTPNSVFTASLQGCGDSEYVRLALKGQLENFCAASGIRLDNAAERAALVRCGRLQAALAELSRLNARLDKRPLKGNSLALAQSVQLMVFDEWEPVMTALETLAAELSDAPPDDGMRRVYAFYVPFLRPETDVRFRENGVRLMGNAAFLHDGALSGFDIFSLAADWFTGMSVAMTAERECACIAAEVKRCGCSAYLTGMFGFDRKMGAAVPLQRRILREKYGVETWLLNSDFWCENAMPSGALDRVDNLCSTTTR